MDVHARVLGVAQDAGVPHAGCACPRCERWRAAPLHPACLGLVAGDRTFLVDATPALPAQLAMLPAFPCGILLTHTHMGHVAGLLQLGEEACDARDVDLFATAGVCGWIEGNEPWSRLVRRGNLRPRPVAPGARVALADGLAAEAFPVAHRDVDTVGWLLSGPRRTLLYLPDVDGWEDLDLSGLLRRCDLALLDGTFHAQGELGRQTRVPHPPVEETLARVTSEEAAKIRFVHLNHTNPLLDADGPAALVAVQGAVIPLDR